MRSIKWCHFQWSWTNPNPVFKVTPLFDAKYLTNGYRYGHSYYRSFNLLNGTNFNDLEWLLTRISRSRYYSTSNNSKIVQDRAIFTMADQYKVAHGLSNGAIFNDFERPLIWFSRSRHSLTLNISQTATDTATVTIRRRIGNHTQAFEWHQFQWHWVTSNPNFKVTILFDVKKRENGVR